MVDKFKHENEIVKTHAQANGKLQKQPFGHSRTGEAQRQQGQSPSRPHQRQQQQGDAFGGVGDKPAPKRDKRDIAEL